MAFDLRLVAFSPAPTCPSLDRNTEIWAYYYDILMRHAFGNMRNIIQEVSYSSMMGAFLTYEGSASLANSKTDVRTRDLTRAPSSPTQPLRGARSNPMLAA